MADKQQNTVLGPGAVEGRIPDRGVMAGTWVSYKASEVDVGTGGFDLAA
jgi:hypothetical protein